MEKIHVFGNNATITLTTLEKEFVVKCLCFITALVPLEGRDAVYTALLGLATQDEHIVLPARGVWAMNHAVKVWVETRGWESMSPDDRMGYMLVRDAAAELH